RGAEIPQAGVRFGGEVFPKRDREPRFADAGLAGYEHHLALAGLCFRPATQQQFDFLFPPDEGSKAAPVQRLETAFHGTRSKHRPGPHRPRDALEVPCPEVIEFEEIAEKPSRPLRDDDRVRLGYALQPRREVRRFANDATLLRLAGAD